MSGTEPVGIAVVGAGRHLARAVEATDELRLAHECDVDDGLERVLADPAVRAVAVTGPAVTHLPVAMAALRSGKHVLVEPPLAPTLADGRALVRAAARRGLVLMLDHVHCYRAAVARLRELTRNGSIGELRFLDSVRADPGPAPPDMDVVWDLAGHDLSIFDVVLPDGVFPVAVAAHGSDPADTGRAGVAHLTIRLSTGALAHVHANRLCATELRTVVVGGSIRTAVWDDLNPARPLCVYGADMIAPVLPAREPRQAVLAEFAAAVTRRRVPLTDGGSGLRVLALLEACTASLRNGGAFVPVEPAMTLLIDHAAHNLRRSGR